MRIQILSLKDYGYCEENAPSMGLALSDKTKRDKKTNLRGKKEPGGGGQIDSL